ncbi:CDP-diacylglycerol--glycerol-3-phosphate 3-phosphatidyltransferase [Neomicrococcus aestuarii]|uniref:Phosphatidylinositol phosphate synthase n=1 Tax=Neomicrococcus aestuarii TaxID=556325 RepID=A0A7W8WZ91_9MICC|nr:CDP-alcohol phosphatidyltransferase family protein [Neomicrococcus aestuarii]MBB5512032.1 CDP-diacylglycerol--glycerol-3-phosphate 3-phosphatidyltransferase [Neomicrococcus aestuarii]
MLNRHAREFFTKLFTPLARFLIKRGVTPDTVTVVGTFGSVLGALILFPMGQLFWGTIVITAFIFSDVVDGIMARLPEHKSTNDGRWGSFLDSTMDRLGDGAIFTGVAIWFFTGGNNVAIGIAALACLVSGSLVSYARAKAEALGFDANTGIAERAERLVLTLVFTGLTGLGLNEWVLCFVLILLALASVVTVLQRVWKVRTQALL